MCTEGMDCRGQPTAGESTCGAIVLVVFATPMELGPLQNASWFPRLHFSMPGEACPCGRGHAIDGTADLEVYVDCFPPTATVRPGRLRCVILARGDITPDCPYIVLDDFHHEWFRAVLHLAGGVLGEGLLCYDFRTLSLLIEPQGPMLFRRARGSTLAEAGQRLARDLPEGTFRVCHFGMQLSRESTLNELQHAVAAISARVSSECDVFGYANVEEDLPVEMHVLLGEAAGTSPPAPPLEGP